MAQADYYRILTQGERSIQCIEENGEVVMVTEFRKTDGGSRQGHVVIKVGHLATVNARVCKSKIFAKFGPEKTYSFRFFSFCKLPFKLLGGDEH